MQGKKPKETKPIEQKHTEPIYILSTLFSILCILFASSSQPQLLFRKYPSLLWYVTKPTVKAAAYGLKSCVHWLLLVLLGFFRLPVLLNSHKFGELFWDTVKSTKYNTWIQMELLRFRSRILYVCLYYCGSENEEQWVPSLLLPMPTAGVHSRSCWEQLLLIISELRQKSVLMGHWLKQYFRIY